MRAINIVLGPLPSCAIRRDSNSVQFPFHEPRREVMSEETMIYVIIPIIMFGLLGILSFVAWHSRKNPDSLSFRITAAGLALLRTSYHSFVWNSL